MQSTGNLPERDPVGYQLAHRVVACSPLAAAHVLARLFAARNWTNPAYLDLCSCERGRWIGYGELPLVRIVAVEYPLHRFPQILQQMPAVHHLDRGWGTIARPARVLGRTIACDNLNAGMLTEPGG